MRQVCKDYVAVISIHAAREGGDAFRGKLIKVADISIHAAREGGDRFIISSESSPIISIHAAREGGDVGRTARFGGRCYFNPRRP